MRLVSIQHRIEHDLDVATARRLIDGAFADYRSRYARYRPELTWEQDRLAHAGCLIRGLRVGARLELELGAVTVVVQAPWPLSVFRTAAVRVIDAEARRVLSLARAGEPGGERTPRAS